MATTFLDCTGEVSAVRATPPGRWAWLAQEITRDDWFIALQTPVLDEIRAVGRFIEAHPVQDLQRRVTEFELPGCEAVVKRMKSFLDDGVGFAVLDRLPMDEFPIETLIEVYWLLGQMVGRPVAQKWNGQMIYHVADTGAAYQYGVRGSHTSVELVFHTDNAFARMVPDYVGLFCRHPANAGGVSRFCSLYTVHDRMMQRYRDSLERLYQPMYFDRQKEHAEGAAKVCLAPYFSWRGNRLYARANSSLVRKGYEVADEPMDDALAKALDDIDAVCADEDIWFEAALERGQVQYLNNHEVGHYRSEFVDDDDPAKKRYLYRLWHREGGSVCYDGIYPPPASASSRA